MSTMLVPTSGHTAIATAIKNQSMYLAWGDIPAFLSAPTGLVSSQVTSGSTSLLNGTTYQYKVTSLNLAGESLVSSSTSITLTGPNVVNLSWTAVANATSYRIYGRTSADNYKLLAEVSSPAWTDDGTIAVGVPFPTTNTTSSAPWTDTPPAPLSTHKGLYREVGRRKATLVKYVVPDAAGPYVTSTGRWSESTSPTNSLYVYVAYDLTDASDKTIYQFGLFIGTVTTTGHENDLYLTPDEITTVGSLLAIENVSPIFRNSSTREIHELVITF